MNKKIDYMEVNQQIDEQGNIIETSTKKTVRIPKEEDYIKVYIKHINYLNNLPQGLDPLIYELIKKTTYENQIVLNSSIKKQIAEVLNKSLNTINQYLSKLVQCDILIRVNTGVYILNPVFYGKGRWEDILELRESLEINISYEKDKYTITHKHKETPNLFNQRRFIQPEKATQTVDVNTGEVEDI